LVAARWELAAHAGLVDGTRGVPSLSTSPCAFVETCVVRGEQGDAPEFPDLTLPFSFEITRAVRLA
jgi:hypothetical protein